MSVLLALIIVTAKQHVPIRMDHLRVLVTLDIMETDLLVQVVRKILVRAFLVALWWLLQRSFTLSHPLEVAREHVIMTITTGHLGLYL